MKDLLKSIQKIKVETNHLVEELLAGAYRSAFKGNGIEFEEVRPYIRGDDIRTIDWNVTARMQAPYIKRFREERELTLFLLVDISASTRFGSKNRTKAELMAELAATLAFSAIKNQDKVGLILFSSEVELYLPPRKGVKHVLRVIREILAFTPKHELTSIEKAIRFLGNIQKRAATVFILSDFISPLDYEHRLKVLEQHHDVILLRTEDPRERFLPPTLVTLRDLETRELQVVDTADPGVKSEIEKRVEAHSREWHEMTIRCQTPTLDLVTDVPFVDSLREFFKKRSRRR